MIENEIKRIDSNFVSILEKIKIIEKAKIDVKIFIINFLKRNMKLLSFIFNIFSSLLIFLLISFNFSFKKSITHDY